MAAALSLASNRQPLVIGKPERNMMDIILNKYECCAGTIVMVFAGLIFHHRKCAW